MLSSRARLAAASASRLFAHGAKRTYLAPPVRDMKFLYELHEFDAHFKTLKHRTECDADTVDMVIDASSNMAMNLAPLNKVADTEGCTWNGPNDIKTPTGFKEAYDQYTGDGWQALSYPEEFGGQGLPNSLALIQSEMLATANFAFLMFPGLSKGCINTILSHATDELKQTWLPPLIDGRFTGTMCLTEPQCGSDLGQCIVKAEPRDDGSYSITGTKIFISCGEHDLADNIVHCVLARLPDAPPGTKGISLFLVPKRHLTDPETGECGELNAVGASRIEDKMGCHGSPTCQLEFDGAQGWLIGTANRGLNHMFTFINTSRVGTAVQGVAAAELQFQNCLQYAKDRKSMRALSGTKEPDSVADAIIHHPSVRNMLLTQKAVAEGGRSMLYECAKVADKMADCEDGGDHAGAKEMDEELAFLTPILKGFLTEMGKEAADLGLQIWGGHGYIKDNGCEQVFRDCRIASLWEGTTQIQALDLLGRKIMLQKLAPIKTACSRLRAQCAPNLFAGGQLGAHSRKLWLKACEWQYLTYRIAAKAGTESKEIIGSSSVDFLMYSGKRRAPYHWPRAPPRRPRRAATSAPFPGRSSSVLAPSRLPTAPRPPPATAQPVTAHETARLTSSRAACAPPPPLPAPLQATSRWRRTGSRWRRRPPRRWRRARGARRRTSTRPRSRPRPLSSTACFRAAARTRRSCSRRSRRPTTSRPTTSLLTTAVEGMAARVRACGIPTCPFARDASSGASSGCW